MYILIFIFLGIIQGFTEPLPISSSGHLVLMQELFNINIPGLSFEAFVNFGSTIAIIIYFYEDLKKLIIEFFKYIFKKESRDTTEESWLYGWKIVVATLPLVVATVIFKLLGIDFEIHTFGVGLALLITALILLIVSIRIKNNKNLISNITFQSALIIGMFQVIALIPGISRSGMTIAGALLIGIALKESFNFSFIMFIPASIGGLLISLVSILNDPDISKYIIGYLLSAVFAFIFTLIGLKLFKNLLEKNKLHYFSLYCFIISISIILSAIINSIIF